MLYRKYIKNYSILRLFFSPTLLDSIKEDVSE